MSEAALALPIVSAGGSAEARRSRLTLLFVVILLTSIGAFVLALVSFIWPIGHGDQPKFADLANDRTYAWVFFVVAGVQLVVGVCAAALAGLVLVPGRGSRLATVGAGLLFLGAAAYGVGIGGWATAYWFASDARTLGPQAASALVDRINSDTSHSLLVPIGGAIIVGVGSLVLIAGIWRARTMPKKILVAAAISTVATVVLPPNNLAGVVAEAVSSVTTVAVGWYALRLFAGPADPVAFRQPLASRPAPKIARTGR